ncbi:aldo/keto reductase [Paenibacillus sp. SI8]|uniref:aldo/keto reductase n=1 Tax=unclassified Paenibacillus TaxID=185978 RepID=UPI0034652C99
MSYRTIGKTGIRVSSLCLGTMSFGGNADEQTSKEIFNRSREKGINFFDTANIYNGGLSEEILGRLIKGSRDELVLTSKVFFPTGSDVNAKGLSRRHIFLSIEDSLRRLQTDRIEFYFVHHFDSQTAIEETLRALDDLQRQGKILYPAVSNWAAWQIAKALGISEKAALARFELIQPMYNLVKRQAEVEILPLAESEQLGVISYSPLGGGLLSGKYGLQRKPEQGRLVDQPMYTKRYEEAAYFDAAERFTAFAKQREVHPATLAVAWVQSHPGITAPIIGARSVEQLEPSLAALDYSLDAETRAAISALTVAPPLATDRSEEAGAER